MKTIYFVLFAILITSCSQSDSDQTSSVNGDTQPSSSVKYYGELKKIMHEGDLSAKADLKDFEGVKNFYALGAMEGLKGEIQIFDGKIFNTYVENNELMFDQSFDRKASLLVYATVSDWITVHIPSEIYTKDELEAFIAQSAEENGIDIHSPFPFILDGNASYVDWHVINWPEGDTEHSHEKHIQSGLHGTLIGEDAKFIGFYSDAHHAIFTHYTTNMHIHVLTKDYTVAGHVDNMELGKEMILKLPIAE